MWRPAGMPCALPALDPNTCGFSPSPLAAVQLYSPQRSGVRHRSLYLVPCCSAHS